MSSPNENPATQEDVTFTRLEDGPHHDGVRFGNGAEVTLQQLGTGVQGWVFDALSSPLTVRETPEVLKEVADSSD
jgi:hypothetical protein